MTALQTLQFIQRNSLQHPEATIKSTIKEVFRLEVYNFASIDAFTKRLHWCWTQATTGFPAVDKRLFVITAIHGLKVSHPTWYAKWEHDCELGQHLTKEEISMIPQKQSLIESHKHTPDTFWVLHPEQMPKKVRRQRENQQEQQQPQPGPKSWLPEGNINFSLSSSRNHVKGVSVALGSGYVDKLLLYIGHLRVWPPHVGPINLTLWCLSNVYDGDKPTSGDCLIDYSYRGLDSRHRAGKGYVHNILGVTKSRLSKGDSHLDLILTDGGEMIMCGKPRESVQDYDTEEEQTPVVGPSRHRSLQSDERTEIGTSHRHHKRDMRKHFMI
ncbi:hypothetical protein HRG_000330 [Hirsutella rhossiliensis]|uniref:Uncharacterized protein n=1 Tax=Hirsutella rhossiliensis TaxID=111463 RepID=A0A9P8N3J8_9HYPO|nr:uncharacterized protein HRG_00330 [Hirsutella rhossiliensis]KAH0967688.1 hypothetical protein HRG_00330 [Hirsutella rhossiliensis]